MTSENPGRFQFRLSTLLILVTAFSLLFGFLAWLLPDDLPTGMRIIIYAAYALVAIMITFTIWSNRQWQLRRLKGPENFVMVKVDAKWQRRVKSKIIFAPIAALTGVSVTFAPGMLLWCGQVQQFGVFEWIMVPLCFLVIYFVPGFYMHLAGEVIAELLKPETLPSTSLKHQN